MRKVDITTTVHVFATVSELSSQDAMLIEQAASIRETAYAPYSKFRVGAALLLENGEIITGNNQENGAYPSGMCAERVAIWKAASEYPLVSVKKIAVSVRSLIKKVTTPVAPCGACRQTLSEYEINQKEPIEIIFMGEEGEIIKTASLSSLLPFSFDNSNVF